MMEYYERTGKPPEMPVLEQQFPELTGPEYVFIVRVVLAALDGLYPEHAEALRAYIISEATARGLLPGEEPH